ncbi:MAG: transposase, partial [Oscillospiraceae bacterium]|nr:transposase [Oscillospiraceae bacterium]
RNGEFEPKVLEKRQTRTDEIEQKILAMYAKGMSQRDIEDSLREIYGAEIPQTLRLQCRERGGRSAICSCRRK